MYHQASDGVDTLYGGHLSERMLNDVHDHVRVWELWEFPALEVPPKCRALWEAADAATLTWTLRQHTDGDLVTVLEIYGLHSPTDNGTHFVWCGDRLSTSGTRRMSLRTAHTRITARSAAAR